MHVRMAIASGLLLLACSRGAQAQGIPVMDVITETQTGLTAVQTTISAFQAIIHTAKWVIDQTGLDELAMGDDWAEDMAQMAALVREAQALGYDIDSMSSMLQATFALESTPDTTAGLQERLWAIRRHVSTGYTYALRTQSLIMTTERTIGHILMFYEKISELLGNLSAQENLSQQLTKLHQLAAENKVTTTAFERARSLDRLTEPLILESLERINENIMADHPGR